ncbi:MAG TPA: response regulator [Acidimicrobiales bacterium]|jgi:DNA-binding response OmpR family regulator|nr:response regulator [Acidimicrobiales bacterium]
MQIVVADDDPVMRALLQLKLEAEGHHVTLARDGNEALALAGSARPGLMVLDVAMPGIDGLEVTRRLRQQPETARLPIVLLTGRDSDPDIMAGWKSGADYYITKPFVMEHLRYFIKTMHRTPDANEPWDDSPG